MLFAPIKGVIAAFRCNQVLEAYHQATIFKCALGSFCSQVHYCCLQIWVFLTEVLQAPFFSRYFVFLVRCYYGFMDFIISVNLVLTLGYSNWCQMGKHWLMSCFVSDSQLPWHIYLTCCSTAIVKPSLGSSVSRVTFKTQVIQPFYMYTGSSWFQCCFLTTTAIVKVIEDWGLDLISDWCNNV